LAGSAGKFWGEWAANRVQRKKALLQGPVAERLDLGTPLLISEITEGNFEGSHLLKVKLLGLMPSLFGH
jgi:hypothetical protein